MKYIGAKRKLVPFIVEAVQSLCPRGTVVDLFSGTSVVGRALKKAGYRVLANDYLHFAHVLATCYVQADIERHRGLDKLIRDLQRARPVDGWFTETYCRKSRFFHSKNGAKIEGIREKIERMGLGPERKAIALTALLEAADRVDSTVGLQMAYLKRWAPRAHNDLELRVPELLPRAAAGKSRAYCRDALRAGLEGDVYYIDPPYNQHSYLGNYHVWETLVRWDAPEVYGKACKRTECQTKKSPFNSKRAAKDALRAVVRRPCILSYSSDGFLSHEEILEVVGDAEVWEIEHRKHISSKLRGGRGGAVTERLYLVV